MTERHGHLSYHNQERAKPDPSGVSRDEKLAAVQRELRMRYSVYPRRVRHGQMSQAEASYEIRVFESIAADYRDDRQTELDL